MRRARPDELTARAQPLFTAQITEDELQEWLPIPFDQIDDPFAAAEPSKGALVALDSGDYAVVHYGLISGQLMVEAAGSNEGASKVLQAFFEEVPLALSRVLWHREGTRLPTARPGLRAVPQPTTEAEPTREAASSFRPRILLIEDESAIRRLLAKVLESVGSVDEAPSVESAIALLTRKRYDVIMLDLSLPNLTSDALKKCIAANSGRRVIGLTGYNVDARREIEDLDPYISALLRLPVDPESLLSAVRLALPQSTTATTADMVS